MKFRPLDVNETWYSRLKRIPCWMDCKKLLSRHAFLAIL